MPQNALEALNGPDVIEPVPGQSLQPQPITVQNITSAIAPMTLQTAQSVLAKSQAPSSVVSPVGRNLYQSPDQRFISENQRPGVPLYTSTAQDPETAQIEEAPFAGFMQSAVSPMLRYGVAKRSSVADQLKYARSVLGEENVRVDKGGHDLIVTLPDKSPDAKPGAVKDVKLNENGMTVGDLAAVASHWPEAAGAILGMAFPEIAAPGLMSKAPGFVQALTTIFAGAAGQKAGEAAKEIGVRSEDKQPLEIGSTLIQKAEQIPGQAALDAATFGAFKLFNLAQKAIRAPLGFWNTPVQLEGKIANERLASTLGVEPISYTPGEASGMPLAIFGEAYSKAKPQARAAWEAFNANQETQKQAIGRAMTALSGTDEQVGNDLISVLQQTRSEKDAALDAIRQTMTTKESAQLDKALAKSVPMPPGQFQPSQAGEAVRTEFQDIFQGVKGKVAKAYDIPGIKTADIPTDTLSADLAKIQAQSSGVPGLAGIALDVPRVASYEQLKNTRAMLRQQIEDSPAERTVKDYYAGKVDNAITSAMEDAAKNIRDPAFKKQIEAANQMYRTEQIPFYQEGIGDLLRKPGVPGSPENMEILNRFARNTDLYRRLVDVAGPKSEPVKIVKQAVVDGVLTKSGTQAIGSNFVNGGALAENLSALKNNPATRELFQDVFGKNGDAIIQQARVLGGVQGTIPKEEAEALMAGSKSVRKVLEAENAIKEEYTTSLMRKIKGGEENNIAIDPQQLVNRFLESATPSEVKAVKSYIVKNDPTLLPQVQDKIVEQILGKAATWDRTSIEAVINNPAMNAKYREFLGDKFTNVSDFAKALGPIESAAGIAQGTGMLVKGQAIGELAKIFRPGPGLLMKGAAQIPGWLAWKAVTQTILSGPVRAWAAKSTASDIPHLLKAAVLSEPVLEEIAAQGSGISKDYAISARRYLNSVGASTTNQPAQPAAPAAKNAIDFLNAP